MDLYSRLRSALQAAAESRTYSWLWKFATVGPVLILALSGLDLYFYLEDPASYPIGWEGGGWKYRTGWNFVVSTGATLAVMATLLQLSFFKGSRTLAALGQLGCLLVFSELAIYLLWLGLAMLGRELGANIVPPIN